MTRTLQNIALVIASIAFVFFAFEIFFRFLPVNSGLALQPVSKSQPYLKASSNFNYVYSKGSAMQIPNKGRVNAQGFVHDEDYIFSPDKPLLAVFGDSYVEALMVPFKETITGILHENLASKGSAYSFAFSGAPLSQYLMWAEYAKNTYKPSAAIFVIISNDFDESLLKYKSMPGFHYLREINGTLSLERVDYSVSSFKRLARKSALLRYLFLNLQIENIPSFISNFFTFRTSEKKFENNMPVVAPLKKIEDSRRAINFFLEKVNFYTGLPNDKILFVVDGLRSQIYAGKEDTSSYAAQMFDFFIREAQEMGFSVVNMQQVFQDDYKINQKRFEFDVDYHWNSYGHEKAAGAVIKHPMFQALYDPAP